MLARLAVAGLRRDLTATAVLGILMAMSVLLAATGVGLLARLSGASENLLDRADAPDLVQMHTGELTAEERTEILAFAEERPALAVHQVTDLLTLEGSELSFAGVSQSSSLQQNSLTVPVPERDRLISADGEVLAEVEPGTVWMPVLYAVEDGLEVGDTVAIMAPDGFRQELEVAGFVRDSLMSTAFASSKRLAVSAEDMRAVAAHTGTPEHLISFWLDRGGDLTAGTLSADYAEAGLPANGPMLDRGAFRLFMMIGEGLVAGSLILISLLVAAIGALCLRLGVLTTLERDRREIGVMRAIGVPDGVIARMHLLRIALVGVPAGLIGLLGALVLEPAVGERLTRFTGESGSAPSRLAASVTALALVAATLAFTSLLLRRLRRASPAAALRADAAGARQSRWGRWSRRDRRRPLLLRRGVPVSAALAVRGIRRSGGRSVLLASVLGLCMMLVVIPSGIAATLSSPRMLTSLGVGAVDVLVQAPAAEDAPRRIAELEEELAADPRVQALSSDAVVRRQMVTGSGERIAVPVAEGERGVLDPEYAQGRPPTGEGEIALSLLALVEAGASVGDTLEMVRAEGAGGRSELVIVGSYQDLTHGGITGRVQAPQPEDEQAAEDAAGGGGAGRDAPVERYAVGITIAPGIDVPAFAEELAHAHPGFEIAEAEEHRDQLLGPLARQMGGAAQGATLAAMALAALMSAMVLRLDLASQRDSISVHRDLGLGDALMLRRITLQMLMVLVLGITGGAVGGALMGQGLLNLALEATLVGPAGMLQGASRIRLESVSATTLLLMPVLMAGVVGGTSALTARSALRAADGVSRAEGAEG